MNSKLSSKTNSKGELPSRPSLSAATLQGSVPAWALPVAITICVVALALIVWRFSTGNGEVGPTMKVHAGMYDIRQEIQKARATKEQQGGTKSP